MIVEYGLRRLATAAAVAALVVAGCGGSTASSAPTAAATAAPTVAPTTAATEAPTTAPTEAASVPPAPGSMGTIGVSVPVNNEFCQCFATGVIQEAEAAGYKVVIAQGGFDDNTIIGQFDTFISEGVKGIVVLPASDNSSSQGTLAAQKANIPVSNAGWFTPTPADSVWVGRLNVDVASGATMIADWIGKNTEAGEVVFVSGAPGLPTNDAFETALGPAIDGLGGGWKLVGIEPGFYTKDGGIKAIENLMTAHPNAKIVVALSADMADGVGKWMTDNKRTELTVISGDSNLALIPNMEAGLIKANLYWGPAEQGQSATNLLLQYLATGKPATTDITPIPISIETKDTIAKTTETRPICVQSFLDQAAQMR